MSKSHDQTISSSTDAAQDTTGGNHVPWLKEGSRHNHLDNWVKLCRYLSAPLNLYKASKTHLELHWNLKNDAFHKESPLPGIHFHPLFVRMLGSWRIPRQSIAATKDVCPPLTTKLPSLFGIWQSKEKIYLSKRVFNFFFPVWIWEQRQGRNRGPI